MSGFQTAITIADVLEKIRRGDMAMPAIQRDYEWDASRIEWLFDSLMREYPISSFLFWEVRGESVGNYKFYTFLKNYREDFKIRGEERVITPGDRFWAILDGQQRLTSLYIGFYGSYAWRVPYGRKDLDNETSRPTRKLYLNISNTLAEDEDEQGRRYIFQFKTEEESRGADLFLDTGNNQWFRVGRILSLTRRNDFNRFVTDNGLSASAQEILGALADMVESRAVNYYLEEDNNLHKALDIFIRINRGGAQLSISTIILSIAISFWHGDAKRAFDNLRAAVLQEGFGVDNDFILKAFLYLHSKDIKFKVTNFKRETAELMEGNWENLANSIIETFRTIKVFGYNDQRLPARNVLMPIIYYIYHKQAWDGFSIRTAYSQDREVIRKWLHNAVVHKIVGASSDAVLTRIRTAFTDDITAPMRFAATGFPAARIREILGAVMAVSDEFLEEVVHLQKDDGFTFAALALLFPHLDYRNSFHKDHMHPAAGFRNCDLANIAEGNREFYDPRNGYWWNSIVNLQMLDGVDNESKNGRPLATWVEEEVNRGKDIVALKQRCIIPQNVSLSFNDFPAFARAREAELKNRFRQVLA